MSSDKKLVAQKLKAFIEENQVKHESQTVEGQFLKIIYSIWEAIQDFSLADNPLQRDKNVSQLIRLFDVTATFQKNNGNKIEDLMKSTYEQLYNTILEELIPMQDQQVRLISILSLKNTIINYPIPSKSKLVVDSIYHFLQNDENKFRELTSEIITIQFQFSLLEAEKDKDQEMEKYLRNLINETFEKTKKVINKIMLRLDIKDQEIAKQIQQEQQKQYLNSPGEIIVQQKYIDQNMMKYTSKMKTYAESYLVLILGLVKQKLVKFDLGYKQPQQDKEKQEEEEKKNDDNDNKENVILDILEKAMSHNQKFVRVAALQIMEAILEVQNKQKLNNEELENNEILQKLVQLLVLGLTDDYTNVRVQAMKTGFDLVVFVNKNIKIITPILSHLCFNRHHPAEGLHSYSRQTWFEVFQQAGRQLMGDNIENSIENYYNQCFNRNYEIRNAAAICFNELITRIIDLNENTLNIFYKNIDKIALGLINLIYFEVNSLVREEGLNTMISLLLYKDKIQNKDIINKIEECCFFHLPDQSSVAKQNAAKVIQILASEQEQCDKLLSKCEKELNSLQDPEKMEKELQNVEKYVKNISKESLMIRHFGDHLEGYAFLAREMVVKIEDKKVQQEKNELFINLIMKNLVKADFDQIENIVAHIIQIVDNLIQNYMDKKGMKNSIQYIVEGMFKCAKHKNKVGATVLLPLVNKLFTNLAFKIGYEILKSRVEQHDMGQFANDFSILTLDVPQ